MTKPFPSICPFADKLVGPDKLIKDKFPDGSPTGIVIHHTADRDADRVRRSLEQKDLCYHFIIERNGQLAQHAWADHQVWHAGKAIWNGFSPNHHFLSVALLSWGEVKNLGNGMFETWDKEQIKMCEVAKRPSNLADSDFWWDAATSEQYQTLVRLTLWACINGVQTANICGHDECALPPGRKSDPGGVLPVKMAMFRDHIWQELHKPPGGTPIA